MDDRRWTTDKESFDRLSSIAHRLIFEVFMSEQSEMRFGGVVDHVAVSSEDLTRDVREYERIGFRVETLYHDWAMLRDARGFGVALLGPGSKHPPHMGLRVGTRGELEEAARRENRPVKEHRDRTVSFYTKGVGGQIVEVIYYPPDYDNNAAPSGV